MIRTVVLLTPGLYETEIWGERSVAGSMARALEAEIPGAHVLVLGREDRDQLAALPVDLLISAYTGPQPPWRWDDVAQSTPGVSILMVYNHADLLDEFSGLAFDGFITNSRSGVAALSRQRPAAWVPLGADPELHHPVPPRPEYRCQVAFLGSGGLGHRTPQTIGRYLGPATAFDLQLWGSHWDDAYWAPVYAQQPEVPRWQRHWRGPLPLADTAALYSSAEIVLGFHEESQRRAGMWNNRVFETLACGALLVCDDAEGLAAEFGEAVVITPGGEALAGTLRDLLADPAERARRRALGRQLVLERYTYPHWAALVHAFARDLAGVPA